MRARPPRQHAAFSWDFDARDGALRHSALDSVSAAVASVAGNLRFLTFFTVLLFVHFCLCPALNAPVRQIKEID